MSLAYSTIIDRVPDSSSSDADAVERLKDSIALQQAAFRRDPYPSAPARREHIRAIAGMLIANREQVRAALAEDFGSHPDEFADLIEILGPVGRVAHALESLDDWMADDARPTDPGLFGSGRAFVRYEPKGVIGNMTPWNFPFEVACGPLVEMLAAGNRVIIKPSDLTPASGEALAEIIAQTFDRDHVTVAVGGLELAKQFASQPWDHLMYTGSPGVGREVMRAAAEHLVPVTLELGGKCPAVLTPSADLAMAVEAIIGTKLIKNGQVCISVDHVLAPRDRLREVVDLVRVYAETHVPEYSHTSDCVGIITERHLNRLQSLLQEARDSGAEIIELEPGVEPDPFSRRMPLTLVVDPPADLRICREEIFGPILPVIPYDSLAAAAAAIDTDDRPLAVYAFGEDHAECELVLRYVRSGGATVNACVLQGAIPSLGFGGTGTSGIGRHHGVEGFREFTNPRGVVVRGTNDNIDILYPPYGDKVRSVIAGAVPA